VTITEDSATLHNMLLHNWDHSLDAFVFDAVNYINLGATTEHTKHPPDDDVVPETMKFAVVDL